MMNAPIQHHEGNTTKTIVLIEDDPDVLRMMHAYLEQHYYTYSFSDGAEALSFIRDTPPDVIVSDVMMPNISGYELLQALREEETTAMIPFIFLTARADYEDIRNGMVHGADDYLTKPVDMIDLRQAIDMQLRKQNAKRERIEATIRVVRENLTYALPHELRTPLFQIIGYVDMLKSDLNTLDEETILQFLDQIAGASERMHRLVENYSVHLQLEALAGDATRRQSLRSHIIRDVAATVEGAVSGLAEHYNRMADIDYNLQPHALRISEQNINKIVFELVDNALKFSSEGQILTVSGFKRDGDYHLAIRDTGVGMTKDQLQQIGQPFLQFDRKQQEQRGIGLGFSIAKRLVEYHDGEITVQSKPHTGTRVYIKLPI